MVSAKERRREMKEGEGARQRAIAYRASLAPSRCSHGLRKRWSMAHVRPTATRTAP